MKIKITIFFCLLTTLIYAQGSDNKSNTESLRKNAVYGTVGFFPIYFFGGGSIEHLFTRPPGKVLTAFGVRVGAGPFALWEDTGMDYYLNFNALVGRNKHHFEIGAGPMLMHMEYDNENSIWPSGNIGYRFQKPGKNFIFRAGGGWPEAAYLSVGIAF